MLRLILPLPKKIAVPISSLSQFLDKEEKKTLKKLAKEGLISFSEAGYGTSPGFPDQNSYIIEVKKEKSDKSKRTSEYKELIEKIDALNKKIEKEIDEKLFKEFSKTAKEKVPELISPNLVGYDNIKKAVSLQLFSEDPIHILLLGDPGTGKTEILRSAAEMTTISSFGLGSGTSSVGLSVTLKGKEVEKGLLPLADKGLCAIDELNLMKDKDYASLYNAMEKGFITYDKGGKHYRFDARIKLLATANPEGDHFKDYKIENIRKQIPFESALISRFNLIFLIRKPNVEEFKEIGRKLMKKIKEQNKNDISFVKKYIDSCKGIDVIIPSQVEKEIIDLGAELKNREKENIIEITPRLIIGIMRMVKAAAKIERRKKATIDDIIYVKEILLSSLEIKNID
jgi:replicative DNA helicase Mcm